MFGKQYHVEACDGNRGRGRIIAMRELSVGVAGLGRLGISPWLCEAGVRQDSM